MKLGSDGGFGAPYIAQEDIKKCECCGVITDTRMGVCFDCAECEAVIATGLDMYDNPIPLIPHQSTHMAKVRYILLRAKKMFLDKI